MLHNFKETLLSHNGIVNQYNSCSCHNQSSNRPERSPRAPVSIPLTLTLSVRCEDESAARKKADESLMSTEQALSHKEALLLAAFREHDEVMYWGEEGISHYDHNLGEAF